MNSQFQCWKMLGGAAGICSPLVPPSREQVIEQNFDATADICGSKKQADKIAPAAPRGQSLQM
jgi:hypothetical protein